MSKYRALSGVLQAVWKQSGSDVWVGGRTASLGQGTDPNALWLWGDTGTIINLPLKWRFRQGDCLAVTAHPNEDFEPLSSRPCEFKRGRPFICEYKEWEGRP